MDPTYKDRSLSASRIHDAPHRAAFAVAVFRKFSDFREDFRIASVVMAEDTGRASHELPPELSAGELIFTARSFPSFSRFVAARKGFQ